MKKTLYIIAVVTLLSACSTSKKATVESKPAPIPPEGITFNQFANYKHFASIQLPIAGKGFSKEETGNLNDAGEPVPTIRFRGPHINTIGNLFEHHWIKTNEDSDDINVALESLKNSFFLKSYLKKENVVEEYTDVEIGGKTCKRVFVHYNYTKGDYSDEKYALGYLVPHNGTTAYITLEKTKEQTSGFETVVELVDEVLQYMVATVEFREYNK